MITLRPQELPRLRDGLIEFAGTRIAAGLREMDFEQERMAPEPVARSLRRSVWALQESDLYFVGTEMAELVSAAAKTLPPFALDPDDPPSKAGLAWFEKPVLDVDDEGLPILAVAIGWYAVGHSLIVTTYCHRDMVPIRFRDPRQIPAVFPFGSWQSAYAKSDGAPIPVNELMPSGRTLLASAKTAWLLMRQPLATETLVQPDRAAKRRAAREGHREPPPVRVIALRRPPGSGHGHSDREYHHTWIVRGHWRNQWYPSREVHRPTWIAPHVKGPEGLPLLGGEKVYAWTR